jgi:putative copper export protein
MEELYVIVLRAAHVVAGAFWVGAAFLFFGFINPTLKAPRPADQQGLHGLPRQAPPLPA